MAKSQNRQSHWKIIKTKEDSANTRKHYNKKRAPTNLLNPFLKPNKNADLGGPGDGGVVWDLAM